MDITPINRVAVTNLLDRAHRALRNIDAADYTAPIPRKWIDEVSDAVCAIEEFCRDRDIQLSEFARTKELLDATKRVKK